MRIAGKGLIDRSETVGFRFDGCDYTGFRGDTLASALLASGVRIFGRSFKYHRPRGVMTAGSEEPNALVTVGRGARQVPNVRATVQEIHTGECCTDTERFCDFYPPLWEMAFQCGWTRAGKKYDPDDDAPRLPVRLLWNPSWSEFPQAVTHA